MNGFILSLAASVALSSSDHTDDAPPFPNNCTNCWPTVLPPWDPEWRLHRSTIAMPCNYSGWFNSSLAAEFGVVSFDWSNHGNSWKTRASEIDPKSNNTVCSLPHPPQKCYYPDAEDLLKQVQLVKAVDETTRTWVYRQGAGSGSPSGAQAREMLTDSQYEGFWLHSEGCPPTNKSCGARPKGTRLPYFDFRNVTMQKWFVEEYVGGDTCLGNADVSGLYMDDVTGIGASGTPDATPVLKESGLSTEQAAAWNAGQRESVIRAQTAAVKKHGALFWQNLQPMAEGGGPGMAAPNKASCVHGEPDSRGHRGFPGLRKLCSEAGRKWAQSVPMLMMLWHDRRENGGWLGYGSCTEKADCALDTCKSLDPRGGLERCGPIANIKERLAAFQLVRGPHAFIGYGWQGCAGTDHRRPYFPFPGGPYPCPQNHSRQCSGYTDGARWLPPKQWSPEVMDLEFGDVVDPGCLEVEEGVFERKYANITVRLDCQRFEASFLQTIKL